MALADGKMGSAVIMLVKRFKLAIHGYIYSSNGLLIYASCIHTINIQLLTFQHLQDPMF